MIKVIKSGLYTSIQDLGRAKYAAWGVPSSGAMDSNSAKRANQLLGNNPEDAVLECTMVGPELEFGLSSYFTVTGGAFDLFLDDISIDNDRVYEVRPGQRLQFGKLNRGLRAYLGIAGGFHSEIVLGSRSYYFPITEVDRIFDSQQIPYHECSRIQSIKSESIKNETALESTVMKVRKGPEFHLLTEEQQNQIEELQFSVSNRNNRMAYQLKPPIGKLDISILTCPVIPGTVQMTPEGSLFVLMRDGQTTGGYPRVLQLTEESLDSLAQLRTGSFFSLEIIK